MYDIKDLLIEYYYSQKKTLYRPIELTRTPNTTGHHNYCCSSLSHIHTFAQFYHGYVVVPVRPFSLSVKCNLPNSSNASAFNARRLH
jgi:hypothetical protein